MSDDPKGGPAAEPDNRDFVADLDVGARSPENWQGKFIAGLALVWAILQVFNASPLPSILAQGLGMNFIYVTSGQERVIHLAFGLVMACVAFPLFKNSSRKHIPWYDWLLSAAGVGATLYLIANQSAIADRSGLPTTADLVASAVGLCIVLIATYRALGLPMVVVASFFIIYVFFGDRSFIPEAMQWKGASFGKAMWHFWMQNEGVFGTALGVSASMVFLFVLFGSLLEKAGAGNYFIKLAFAMMGHLKGGPAKAAVVASAATGLISGSSIANTVTTGTFTIPLMKRVGFSAEKAGAVEVASSTNGQLTPPVMGAAAFLMVEYVGIPYLEVVKHAFLPAIISYIALVYIVHLEAAKMGLEGLPRPGVKKTVSQRMMGTAFGVAVFCGLSLAVYYGLSFIKPMLGDYTLSGICAIFLIAYLVLIRWAAKEPDLEVDDPNAPFLELPMPGPIAKSGTYYALPVIVLIWNLMIERKTPGTSAFWATMAMMFVMLTQHSLKAFFRGETDAMGHLKAGWDNIIEGMIAGSRNMIGIAVATGTAGIIVGTVSLTGAHQVIGEFIEIISGGSLLLMLVFVALFSLVLGMGLPTTATYIVITSLMAPVIIAVGAKSGLIVPLIAVHLFVFYFGILADDTPPVGLAAFAAAAISKGDPIKTGIIGFSYDVRTAILPFLFIFNTELLLIDVSVGKAVFVFIIAVIAMMLFAAATQNWFLTRSKMWENAALLLIAFTLFTPGFWLNQWKDPYVFHDPAKLVEMASVAEDGTSLRIRVAGEDFSSGKEVETTVALLLGSKSDGDGTARMLKNSGIEFRTEDDGKTYVDNVMFGQYAQKKGVDFDWQVLRVEVDAVRLPKEIFYIPALLLLGLVIMLQLGRARKAETAAV
ncbi:MAG: TRAP transporter permease [Rhodobacteraceae bacterium]|nr:TRAP transporter permease [Paracoccaceae bacterium]